ncbi:hypothetical protein [Nonomuraea polychroma]|uniref:hypothetical protein n=1 Tax=Nonomuraea polychroma TaxID=46176 RepID=UPI000FDEEA95|nr:hypothetical protein [Nonomuraea polychroma]
METGVRVTEALAAQLGDLGRERSRRTLRIVAEGDKAKTRKVPPAAAHAIDVYLADRAERSKVAVEQLSGPLFASGAGRDRGLRPHQLRHTFASLAEESGLG